MAVALKLPNMSCLMLLLVALAGCCNAAYDENAQKVCKDKSCQHPDHSEIPSQADEKNILCVYGKYILVNGSKYRALMMIGKGGTAFICKVTDVQLGDTKVIKIIEKHHVKNFREIEALDEVEIHQQLANVSGVAKLYNVENRPDVLLMVMEHIPDNLYDLIQPYFIEGFGAMAKELVRNKSEVILHALKQIHDKGIVHLDLRAKNVMITDDERVRIIDFGASMMTRRSNKAFRTQYKRKAMFYSAPELVNETYTYFDLYECERQAMREEEAGSPMASPAARTIEKIRNDISWYSRNNDCSRETKVGLPADVWSFGVLLYEMMYGKTPFEFHLDLMKRFAAYNYVEVFDAVMPNGIITQYRSFVIDFPDYEDPILSRMVKDCLQRDPKLRPTVNELLQRFK